MTKKTKQIFVVAVVIALFTAGVGGFLYQTIKTKITNLDRVVTILKAQNAKEAAHVNLTRLLNETEKERTILNSYFFSDEGDAVSFISEVESLAKTIGLTRPTESIDKVTDSATKNEMVKMVFRVSGEKERVVGFLKLMENISYHSTVESFYLNQTAGRVWEGRITMFVTIKSL
jgi:hypothetical protein